MAMGAVLALTTPSAYIHELNILKRLEEIETERLLETGAAKKTTYGPFRPVFLGAASLLGFYGYYGDPIISESAENFNQLVALDKLYCVTFSLYVAGETAVNYFRDQLMTPPSKKKKFWKTMYEKIIPLQEKLEPVKVPTD